MVGMHRDRWGRGWSVGGRNQCIGSIRWNHHLCILNPGSLLNIFWQLYETIEAVYLRKRNISIGLMIYHRNRSQLPDQGKYWAIWPICLINNHQVIEFIV